MLPAGPTTEPRAAWPAASSQSQKRRCPGGLRWAEQGWPRGVVTCSLMLPPNSGGRHTRRAQPHARCGPCPQGKDRRSRQRQPTRHLGKQAHACPKHCSTGGWGVGGGAGGGGAAWMRIQGRQAGCRGSATQTLDGAQHAMQCSPFACLRARQMNPQPVGASWLTKATARSPPVDRALKARPTSSRRCTRLASAARSSASWASGSMSTRLAANEMRGPKGRAGRAGSSTSPGCGGGSCTRGPSSGLRRSPLDCGVCGQEWRSARADGKQAATAG